MENRHICIQVSLFWFQAGSSTEAITFPGLQVPGSYRGTANEIQKKTLHHRINVHNTNTSPCYAVLELHGMSACRFPKHNNYTHE